MTAALATIEPRRSTVFAIEIRSLDEAWRYAEILAASSMVPNAYRGKPGDVLVAMQMGAEVGLAPLAALQNIAVINGRPSIWGDAFLALIQASPLCVDVIEWIDESTKTAYCTMKRRGREDKTASFSLADAERARLLGKAGPWTEYPRRMCQMRARAWAGRDQFADVLRGLACAEEMVDATVISVTTPQPQLEAPKPAVAPAPQPAAAVAPPAQPKPPAPPRPALSAAQTLANQVAHVELQPTDFVVQAGKNAGKRLGDLDNKRIDWYAENSQDPRLKAAAVAVRALRIPPEPRPESAGEYIDPETGEVMPAIANATPSNEAAE